MITDATQGYHRLNFGELLLAGLAWAVTLKGLLFFGNAMISKLFAATRGTYVLSWHAQMNHPTMITGNFVGVPDHQPDLRHLSLAGRAENRPGIKRLLNWKIDGH